MLKEDLISHQLVTEDKYLLSKQLRKCQTPAEKVLWDKLRGSRLNGRHFRRQQIIAGYIVDFYCHSAGVVIELDGPIHLQQKDYDQERDAALNEIGLKILRFKNDEVEKDLDGVLHKIFVAM